jgi:hypothetical protein
LREWQGRAVLEQCVPLSVTADNIFRPAKYYDALASADNGRTFLFLRFMMTTTIDAIGIIKPILQKERSASRFDRALLDSIVQLRLGRRRTPFALFPDKLMTLPDRLASFDGTAAAARRWPRRSSSGMPSPYASSFSVKVLCPNHF